MNELNIEIIKEIAKNLSETKIFEILQKNKHRPQDEIINIVMAENANFVVTATPNPIIISQNLDLIFTQECKNAYCPQENCNFYHNLKQRRRDLTKFRYKNKPCDFVFRNNYWNSPYVCKKKDQCGFCHTENELKFHKDNHQPNLVKANEEILQTLFEECKKNEVLDVQEASNMLQMQIITQTEALSLQQIKLEEIKKELERMKKILLCVVCYQYEYEFIYLACGHPVCAECRCLPRCPKCKINSSVIPIRF